jgi:hypothetical protein
MFRPRNNPTLNRDAGGHDREKTQATVARVSGWLFVGRRRQMCAHTPVGKRRLKKRWLAIAFLLASATWWFWPASDEWVFHRKLPRTAQEVHEWSWSDDFLPNYAYLLTARMKKEEFDAYVTGLGLTMHTPSRKYEEPPEPWLDWGTGPSERTPWWNPSPSLQSTFVAQSHDRWTFAKYEKGRLFLKSLHH